MKRSSRIAKCSVSTLLCFFIANGAELPGETALENKIRSDDVLVAPGIGAQSVLLDDSIDSIMQKAGRDKFKFSKPAVPGDVFKDIFHVSIKIRIAFDAIYYNEYNNLALFVHRGNVVAIIGLVNTGITAEGVSLKAGINNFIFNYGNNNIVRLLSGSHGMYIYPSMGIAVVDDDMNDTIDLYVVFAPQSRGVG
jgi:hypothetical protein